MKEITFNGAYCFKEYQQKAARTINQELDQRDVENHALLGMASEVGEIQGLYQKVYQGHEIDDEHLKKEVGDLLWFVAEFCTCKGWDMGDIGELNIQKLIGRFPNGFEADKSLHRAEGDV